MCKDKGKASLLPSVGLLTIDRLTGEKGTQKSLMYISMGAIENMKIKKVSDGCIFNNFFIGKRKMGMQRFF
jgi:hypothetical protein